MKIALKGLWDSTARTFVPLIVGGILGWLVRMGFPVDPEFEGYLYTIIDLAIAGLYWLIVRVLEVYVNPKFSVLLGSLKQPMIYAKPDPSGTPVITDVTTTGSVTTVELTSSARSSGHTP